MTRPIRVAMVHYRDNAIAGGSLRVGEAIANHVDPTRVSVEFVFAYDGPGPVTQRARVPSHFIHSKGPKDFAAWKRARDLFTRLQPDIIHFQEGVVWLRTALLRTPAKKVIHVHGRYSDFQSPDRTIRQKIRSALDARVSRSYFKHTDAQICINQATRNWLLDLGMVSPETSCVVYNAIDVARFASLLPRAAARAELGLPQDALLLGFVGRLVWEKGCSDFLAIVDRLPERWHGVICGDGPLRNELQSESVERGVEKRIHFLGSLDDVAPVYAALDAYAFVSRYDAFGLTVAEAMAARVPVFGIERAGDYNEASYPLIRPEATAMVKCESERDLEKSLDETTRHITAFGERPEIFRDSIEGAHAWVSNCFAAPIQAEAMTRVYEEICREGRPLSNSQTDFYQSKREAAERINDRLTQTEAVAATA